MPVPHLEGRAFLVVEDQPLARLNDDVYAHRIRRAKLAYVTGSRARQMTIAKNYVGLAYEWRQTTAGLGASRWTDVRPAVARACPADHAFD